MAVAGFCKLECPLEGRNGVVHGPKHTADGDGAIGGRGRNIKAEALCSLGALPAMRLERYPACRDLAGRGKMQEEPSGLVTYRGAVYATHCDHIGHMNIVSYGAKFDEANWVFFCEIGLTPSYLRGERYGMAGVQQTITYKQELFAGDVIEVRSQVLEVAEKRLRVRHEMRNIETGAVAAVSEITAVHLDKQGHKACQLPEAVRQAAESMLAGRR